VSGYEPAEGQEALYDPGYFEARDGTDPRRQQQFRSETALIRSHVDGGAILDVGCSTGEFLEALDWDGERFGMEISDLARAAATARGVRFDLDLFTEGAAFDAVVFRGTIQHLDEPFRFVKQSFRALRPGGFVFFLATPNANSPVYRRTRTLPFLDPPRNFYVPDDINFPNALRNYGFEVVEVRYPYLRSPYRRLVSDHCRYLRNLVRRRNHLPHAFWRSSMEVVARRPAEG
jgi:SAM-dependent methyltransferase